MDFTNAFIRRSRRVMSLLSLGTEVRQRDGEMGRCGDREIDDDDSTFVDSVSLLPVSLSPHLLPAYKPLFVHAE
jgi:hypothetical protein